MRSKKTHYIVVDPKEKFDWDSSSWVERFRAACRGTILIRRDVFCAALVVEDFPDHTMMWEEWLRWLYRRLAGRQAKYNRSLRKTHDSSDWWFTQIAPMINKRLKMTKHLKKACQLSIQYDGFCYSGDHNIITNDGKVWIVMARTDTWVNNEYRMVMLVHRNNLLCQGGDVHWGVLSHTQPREAQGYDRSFIDDMGSQTEAYEEYLDRVRRLTADSIDNQVLSLHKHMGGDLLQAHNPIKEGDA